MLFGEYVIVIKKNCSLFDQNISLVLYDEYLIVFSFLTAYKNQLKKQILNALSSNQSPFFCSFVNNDTFVCRSGVWKFNNSLLFNTYFVKKIKVHIEIVKSKEKSSFRDTQNGHLWNTKYASSPFLPQQV